MAKTSGWMPNSKTAQLATARMWLDVLREETKDASGTAVKKYAAWGISAEVSPIPQGLALEFRGVKLPEIIA